MTEEDKYAFKRYKPIIFPATLAVDHVYKFLFRYGVIFCPNRSSKRGTSLPEQLFIMTREKSASRL